MKPSAWLPLLAISTYALVISTPTDPSHNIAAIAGSIAETNSTHISDSNKSPLEIEYEALELLKQQLFHLHHEVIKKERDILHIINQDFRSCSGVKCYLQTALRKAPDFLELFKTHFRHHSKNSTDSYGCLWSTNSSRALEDPTSLTQSEEPFEFNAGGSHSPFDFNEEHNDGPFDFNGGPDQNSPFEFNSDDRKHPFEFNNDEPVHPDFQPGPGHHPDHHDGHPPHHSTYDPNKPNDAPPAFHPQGHKPHHERPPFHMPHPAPRPRYYKLILATAGLVVSLLILGVLFKALRIYCANPRVRAERAARREECRTKREYRRAACQHRLRQCLSRFRRRPRALSTDDYEEKRATLRAINAGVEPSNIENHIIGAHITSLRRAHELVGHLMRAEEGRSFSFAATQPQDHPQIQTHIPPQTQQITINNLPSSSRSLHSIRTTTTLPLYAPPPPRYSQELARDIHVVDGFRYTPTQSDATITSSASSFILDDDFTESSVVDCTSRLSMETDAETDRGRGRSRSCGKMSLELAGDRYRGRFD